MSSRTNTTPDALHPAKNVSAPSTSTAANDGTDPHFTSVDLESLAKELRRIADALEAIAKLPNRSTLFITVCCKGVAKLSNTIEALAIATHEATCDMEP